MSRSISLNNPVPETLVDVVQRRAAETPDALAYAYLSVKETVERTTYAELERRSRGIATHLQELGLTGQRALIALAPGLDYVAAFVGCLFASVVPVPAYPPPTNPVHRTLDRFRAIAASAKPRVLFAEGPTRDRLAALDLGAATRDLRVLVPSAAHDQAADNWLPTRIRSADLAFLQYSSGSTGTPKGVCVTHENLMHNSELIRVAFRHTPESRGVIWLPPYHDMGLVGGILQPLYAGFPVLLMAPLTFLKRPARWMQAISAFRATTSGGPNSAYSICADRISDADKAGLDLSTWNVAFVGAEPVRSATLQRFASAFESCGFRSKALHPCYGLAESTLLVSGGDSGRGAVSLSLSRSALESHRARPAAGDEPAEQVVCCGPVPAGVGLAIVDPDAGTRQDVDCIGEIWIRSGSVAAGYWGLADETAQTFRARLGSEKETFLRTGDLGFVRDGRLFVTGRLKDLIIIRGRNLYPHDIEAAAERSHPLLRSGGGAAFAIDHEEEERLIVVHEVDRLLRYELLAEVQRAIRAAVSQVFDVSVWAIVLIRPASLPRTSSGKIRRGACRDAYLAGQLARWVPRGSRESAESRPQA